MALHVIEGTWEEIKSHEAELIGKQLRVTIKPDKSAPRKASAKTTKSVPATSQTKELRGYGMFAGLISTEDYFREKREDTIREDRLL